jgi:hypothetical protein
MTKKRTKAKVSIEVPRRPYGTGNLSQEFSNLEKSRNKLEALISDSRSIKNKKVNQYFMVRKST